MMCAPATKSRRQRPRADASTSFQGNGQWYYPHYASISTDTTRDCGAVSPLHKSPGRGVGVGVPSGGTDLGQRQSLPVAARHRMALDHSLTSFPLGPLIEIILRRKEIICKHLRKGGKDKARKSTRKARSSKEALNKSLLRASFPSGAKAQCLFCCICGTVKAVPFQNMDLTRASLIVILYERLALIYSTTTLDKMD